MTSSTSSSDQRINRTAPDDRARYHARRVVALKTVVLGGGAIIAGMLLVNALVYFMRAQFPNPFSVQRIQTSAAALPAALSLPADDPRKVVYVLGSSLVEFGFSPHVFDQTLTDGGEQVISYNFGYGNADPSIHELFAQRLETVFAGNPERLDLVVFEFSPFQATERRAQLTGQLDHAAHAVINDWRDFLALAPEDHEQAIALFNTRYVRAGVPAEAITNLLSLPIRNAGRLNAKVIDEDGEPLDQLGWQLYHQLMEEWPQAHPPGGWYEVDRGGLPAEASAEAMSLARKVMKRMQHPDRMAASRQQRIDCCDMLDLNIDDAMLAKFIAAIRHAQTVSKRVDLLLMPRNEEVIQLSETGRANLAAAVDRIRRETGVEVIDMSASGYPVSDFLDADHLTLFDGRRKFSEQLARHYIEKGLP